MMTISEAIEILRDTPIDIRSTREDDIHTLYATAQNMAIEALSNSQNQSDSLIRTSTDSVSEADVIYRADAIDMMVEMLADATTCMMPKDLWREVVTERISKLPSAQRTGEWEELGENKDGTHNIRCNQCGEAFKSKGHAKSYYTKRKYRFCPNCGADMRGGDSDE